ncbi:MAG: inositol monophosphatase family protein [Candidatus Glassbacteria bacterium]
MDDLVKFAIDTAKRAGALLRERVGSSLRIEHKGVIDLVTDADREAEELIVRAIEAEFPGHMIVAEERPGSGGSHLHKWYVDPLDGTTNFSHGYPMFAVSIAHEIKNKLVLGVVYDPMRDELFHAERGKGAQLNGNRVSVSQVDDIDKSLLSTGFPYDLRTKPEVPVREFNKFLLIAQALRRDGSAALDMCYLACGRTDGFWERNLGPWDTAAGQVIVEEAGGIVTDFEGKPHRPGSKTILASNGLIHLDMMEVLASM